MSDKIRVLIVDDSPVIRKVILKNLQQDARIECVGFCTDGSEVVDAIRELVPDVIILDVEMPKVDGIATLKGLRKIHPTLPVIMFGSFAEGDVIYKEAFQYGANEFIAKPNHSSGGIDDLIAIIQTQIIPHILGFANQKLHRKPLRFRVQAEEYSEINAVSDNKISRRSFKLIEHFKNVAAICIGSSTGGPVALMELLGNIRAPLDVPVFIVQHMPATFTAALAARLNAVCIMTVSEAIHGEFAKPGSVYIAPGGYHMELTKVGKDVCIHLSSKPPENNCRPAVDVLFRSMARIYGSQTLAIVLTGMGSDGLKGCQEIVSKNGAILAQDRDSSVVWGMPGAVVQAGLASEVLGPKYIAEKINMSKLGISRDS